jgi:hypothetical protein
VAEGHRTGEGDMIGMRLFSKTEWLQIGGLILGPLNGIFSPDVEP